jgi:hypothetical protein
MVNESSAFKGYVRKWALKQDIAVMSALALSWRCCRFLFTGISLFLIGLALTAFHCGEGDCEGSYSPFLRGEFTGFGGVKGDDMFPGSLTALWDLSTFATGDCGPYAIARRPEDSCLYVPGGEFCQRLIRGDLCYGDAVIEASDVSSLEECILLWGETAGFDFQACTFQGVKIEEGGCDELLMAFDRIKGCLERRGPGALWESPCLALRHSLTPPLNAECPWWESDECFEMYLPPP